MKTQLGIRGVSGAPVLFLVLLLMIAPSPAQAQYTDEFGEEYDSSGIAKTDSGKRDQLFRVINIIRKDSLGLATLSYQTKDQEEADRRAKSIVRKFLADTTNCTSEVVLRGSSFKEIIPLVLDHDSNENSYYLAYMKSMSIGIYRKREAFYVVIRVFD